MESQEIQKIRQTVLSLHYFCWELNLQIYNLKC